jgi:hypothetical protein
MPRSSVRVVRKWCRICTNPVLRCLVNLEGLIYEDMLDDVVPKLVSLLTI